MIVPILAEGADEVGGGGGKQQGIIREHSAEFAAVQLQIARPVVGLGIGALGVWQPGKLAVDAADPARLAGIDAEHPEAEKCVPAGIHQVPPAVALLHPEEAAGLKLPCFLAAVPAPPVGKPIRICCGFPGQRYLQRVGILRFSRPFLLQPLAQRVHGDALRGRDGYGLIGKICLDDFHAALVQIAPVQADFHFVNRVQADAVADNMALEGAGRQRREK